MDYEGKQLVPQCALDKIDKLLLYVRKGFLSHIPPPSILYWGILDMFSIDLLQHST